MSRKSLCSKCRSEGRGINGFVYPLITVYYYLASPLSFHALELLRAFEIEINKCLREESNILDVYPIASREFIYLYT